MPSLSGRHRLPSSRHHGPEWHGSGRAAWLRAAVLGADDGIVSTASLMVGVAAAGPGSTAVVTAGLAGLVAGACSMAAGEYVSVSAQRDAENADRAREREELQEFPEAELRELTEIYVRRGLDRSLAAEVAAQLHRHDALEAHLRDELQLTSDNEARPVQAAAVSALSFSIGAAIPVVVGVVTSGGLRNWLLPMLSLVALGVLGAVGAWLGGAPWGRAAARVLIGGGAAMALTALIGRLVGVVA